MSEIESKVLLKMIILGESGVGKTALSHKYVNNTFIEEHRATIGADFLSKQIRNVDNNKLITLQIWDTAGQERFRSLGKSFFRGADVCVLVYDITDHKTFAQMSDWKKYFLDEANPENRDKFPFLLLGNKCDKANGNREVDQNEAKQYANDNDMDFYETSAMNGQNVESAIDKIASITAEQVPWSFPVKLQLNDNLEDKVDIEDMNNNDDTATAAAAGGCC